MRKISARFMIFNMSLALLAGVFGATDFAAAQDSTKSKTFVVVGTAAIYSNNVSAARERAIADGLITAVALMTEELLQMESFVEQFSQLQ